MASYLLPSFFQKRLLKYALSRLGLFDTDDLDPDNLGITWGQRSTVELRDVGLKLEKLASYLQLPPTCELLNARIQSLRITIPADLINSGIGLEASGIDLHLCLSSNEPPQEKHGNRKQQAIPVSTGHSLGGKQALPTPSNLAESFLESEPREEKEELEAAISSQSHVFQHGSSFGEDDEEEELGLGNEETSLPSFVAGFLNGVMERLQVSIKDIVVRVDMELKQDGPSKRHPEDKPDLVSALLTVGQVDLHGASGSATGPTESALFRDGKRLLSLTDINIGLVSDPGVFSNYSRFTAPASPTTTMQSKASHSSSRAPSPPSLDNSVSDPGLAMTRSTIFEPSLGYYRGEGNMGHGMEESGHEMEASGLAQDGRFSDADSDHERGYERSLDNSQTFGDDPFNDNPGYLDSVIDTQSDDFDDEPPLGAYIEEQHMAETEGNDHSIRLPSPVMDDQAASSGDTEHREIATASPRGTLEESQAYASQTISRFGIESNENTLLSHHDDVQEDILAHQPPYSSEASHHSLSRSNSDNTASEEPTPGAELTESKFFSHDEAQSLYMSAISQGGEESFMPNMPGAWDSFGPGRVSDLETSRRSETHAPTEINAPNPAVQDEAIASTPKQTMSTASYFIEQQTPADSRSESQYPNVENADPTPYPTLNKNSEMRKPVFNVDKISIWLPTIASLEKASPVPLKTSMERTDSDLKDMASSSRGPLLDESLFSSRISTSARSPRISSEAGASETDRSGQQQADTAMERLFELQIEVFSMTSNFDIATGWLVIKALQRLSSMSDAGSDNNQPSKQTPLNQPAMRPVLDLQVREFSVKFIEHVAGYPYPDNSGTFLPPSYPSMEDIVLQLTASGLRINASATDQKMSLKLDVGKFAFGFASQDLVSFDESLKMRESTRDIMTPSQADISLSLTKSADATRVDLSTLPLHINMNIQNLEEVLGWMGGLSTILELGSSISSTPTMKAAHKSPKKRTRGVHFETPGPAPQKAASASTPWKVNARLGGIVLEVVGETHSLKLSTTAVKIVSRFELLGLAIDRAELRGPIRLDGTRDAPAKVILDGIRVEFLSAPKENDLGRLLTLITPSKNKYDDDDDILLDTLLRQRKQGSVLRLAVTRMKATISNIEDLASLSSLGQEMGRLSNVTKYLPEDDRPGILTLTMIREFEALVHVGGEVGDLNAYLTDAEVAWISMPSLTATQVGTIKIIRNNHEELVGESLVTGSDQSVDDSQPPVLMARFIPDEMDPTFKVKLHHLRVEYTVPSIMAFLGLGQNTTGRDLAGEMASSIANLAEHSPHTMEDSVIHQPRPNTPRPSKPTKLAVVFMDSVLGLNPRNSPSKGLIVLTNAKFSGALHTDESSDANLEIGKASIMIIDDVANVGTAENLHQRASASPQSKHVQGYINQGYVPVSSISSAMAVVKVMKLDEDGTKSLDVELRDDLLILETCADSTQTLISILNGLQPPTPPSITKKYQTEVTPIQDMLASFSGNAFAADPTIPTDDSSGSEAHLEGIIEEDELSDELEYVSDFYPGRQTGSGSDDAELVGAPHDNDLLGSFHSQYHVASSLSELNFQDDHFAKQSAVGGTAHRWDSTHNTYGLSNDTKLQRSPLRVRVRDMHVIWNLFDGYDWQRTRDTISKAVKEVESKAIERRARASRMSPSTTEDEESVIGDFLFNSIYIGIPANKDPRELQREIDREINDLNSETDSYATTTTVTATTSRQGRSIPRREKKGPRLYRSKAHKMSFELRGVCADLVVFPQDSEETQSSLDVRVRDLEIYDHVPTSTWRKFATYMHEAGERESGTSMIHLEILTVKPVPELAASEIVLKATVLPIRLHVDQDALEFMSRFFEFRDESIEEASTPGDVPFLQRVEVNSVQVKLDFKPKRVDYAGLRSGRTTEFMNFFVLDNANMVLRHVIIYGVSGFDRLGNTLNDIWMPDVKRNQLPGVLAGLAPIRSLVNVGGGVKDLVVIPMREYQKDGRIVRSIQKGALAFAKTTSNELVKLGAKLAIGTQTVLQGAEDLLTTPNAASAVSDENRDDEDEAKKISLYADQPIGVVQGLRGAFRGLERDLLLARDAIVAVPGEVVESGSATAAARAVWKRAPTVVLRPAIGVSKAVGRTLLGAGNTLDPSNRRKMEDKYKLY
ncbi:hypothetical protein N7481_009984 [Penicillium waksmanii]|uniref:uncharacterized protein n=1 Tax=Penicillium waksmanii TaxID=69791 RepID=UPI002547B212|nr:uncharacterized protein N7481_009984 [Penicillium waksmanii]KAJ5976277.1 hypothetical protein N7481_009984 [Penicillium waksmanii]